MGMFHSALHVLRSKCKFKCKCKCICICKRTEPCQLPCLRTTCPAVLQVLYMSTCGMLWTGYLSHASNQ